MGTCTSRFIYPVRYALSSESAPPLSKAGSINQPGQLSPVPGYNYTLRSLRQGFVYLYDETHKVIKAYTCQNDKFSKYGWQEDVHVDDEGEYAMPAGNDQEYWLEVLAACEKLYIAYSENPWSKAKVDEICNNTQGTRSTFMQEVSLKPAGSTPYTAPISQLNTLVEEFRESPGYLDSLREHPQVAELFKPDTTYENIEPSDAVALSWRHSGVLLGKHKDYLPLGQQTDETTHTTWRSKKQAASEPRNKMAETPPDCSTPPIILALFDPFGVARDLVQINMANEQALKDYMHWYQHPVTSGKYLIELKNYADKRMAQLRRSRTGVLTHEYDLCLMIQRNIPNTVPIKQFLNTYAQDETKCSPMLEEFGKAWKTWLKSDKNDNLLTAFGTFDENFWMLKEISFAACHLNIANLLDGLDAPHTLYVGEASSKEHKDLLLGVLKAQEADSIVSNATVSILSSFAGAFVKEVAETKKPVNIILTKADLNLPGLNLPPLPGQPGQGGPQTPLPDSGGWEPQFPTGLPPVDLDEKARVALNLPSPDDWKGNTAAEVLKNLELGSLKRLGIGDTLAEIVLTLGERKGMNDYVQEERLFGCEFGYYIKKLCEISSDILPENMHAVFHPDKLNEFTVYTALGEFSATVMEARAYDIKLKSKVPDAFKGFVAFLNGMILLSETYGLNAQSKLSAGDFIFKNMALGIAGGEIALALIASTAPKNAAVLLSAFGSVAVLPFYVMTACYDLAKSTTESGDIITATGIKLVAGTAACFFGVYNAFMGLMGLTPAGLPYMAACMLFILLAEVYISIAGIEKELKKWLQTCYWQTTPNGRRDFTYTDYADELEKRTTALRQSQEGMYDAILKPSARISGYGPDGEEVEPAASSTIQLIGETSFFETKSAKITFEAWVQDNGVPFVFLNSSNKDEDKEKVQKYFTKKMLLKGGGMGALCKYIVNKRDLMDILIKRGYRRGHALGGMYVEGYEIFLRITYNDGMVERKDETFCGVVY